MSEWENRVLCGDAGVLMKDIPLASIPFTLTSPPYADLRTYGGHGFDFEPIAEQLWRVTAEGGVLVWVIGDKMEKDSETGMPYKQVLKFMNLGFKLHDTMIFNKQNYMPARNQRRYAQQFEFMFVFSKGKPSVFNPIKEPCKYAGVKSTGKYFESPDTKVPYRGSAVVIENGQMKPKEIDDKGKVVTKKIAKDKVKGNVWTYWVGNNTHEVKKAKKLKGDNQEKQYHTAAMNMSLAKDHILSWTNPGDLVFDPMCGGGTTLLAAKALGRHYLGIEICSEYSDMAIDRLAYQV